MNEFLDHGPTRIAIIIASVRSNRVGAPVTSWILEAWHSHPNLSLDVIDLQDFTLPADLDRSQPGAVSFARQIDQADAAVIVTPEYNHSYPGQLKIALDLIGSELNAKPVAFVAYGGISGGLRSVEHLRPVVAELGAMSIRNTVSLPYVHSRIGQAGELEAGVASTKALGQMLDQLLWWSSTLREGKASNKYVA